MGSYHSRYYQRYFEGYTETVIPNPDGSGSHTKMTYTGDYYRRDLPEGKYRLRRFLYAAICLGTAALYFLCTTRPVGSNCTKYVVLPEVVVLACILRLSAAAAGYVTAARQMEIRVYRNSSLALKKASLACAVGLGLTALAVLVFLAVNPSENLPGELSCMAGYMAGALMMLWLNRMEEKQVYLKTAAGSINQKQ